MAGHTFKRFSDEQIERADRVDVVEYARSVGLEIEKSGSWYKAKGQGGLYFNRRENKWGWHTHGTGGRGAISLCMEYENKTWIEAVRTLLGEEMEAIRYAPDWKLEPEPPKEFHLPDRNYTYRHMFAYLTKTRGIDPGILKVLVDRGYIYENTKRSCVFVGRDKEGTAKHASVRSTNTEGKTFKQDVPGSQKAYSFSISGKSGVLNVFEAPIDALSYISLQKLYGKQMKDSYVALGGVMDKALKRFLEEHTDVEKIRVCTDNDQAGEMAALRIKKQYGDKYTVIRHRPTHKDFNEDLVAIRKQEQLKEQEQGENRKQEQQVPEQNQAAADQPPQDFFIKGECEVLVLCDNKEEIEAYREVYRRNYKKMYGSALEPDEYYLAYRNTEQVKEFIKEYPGIKKIWICTNRTPEGVKAAEDIAQAFDKMEHRRELPKLDRYSEDLAQMNKLEEVLNRVPLEEMAQMEQAAGMEM